MRWSTPVRWVCVSLALVMLLTGCNVRQAAQKQKKMNELKAIGIAYHNYVDANAKAPTAATDLKPYLQGFPEAERMLADGTVVFLYGVKPNEMPQGSSLTVVAYEAQAPTSGGIVLLGDGSVKTVTANEFQGLSKAEVKEK